MVFLKDYEQREKDIDNMFCELSLELAEIIGAVDSRPNIYFYVDLVTGDVFRIDESTDLLTDRDLER